MTRSLLLFLPLVVSCLGCARTGTDNEPSAPAEYRRSVAWQLERTKDPATGRVPQHIRRKELAFAKTLPARSGAKSLAWTHRGPRNRGGRTRGFAVDVTNSQVLLAGGVSGGIWRSTNAGQSWTKTLAPAFVQNISCLAQDTRTGSEQAWYAGTGENYGIVSGTSFTALLPGDGIFKSMDGGLSWAQLPSTVAGDHENYTRNGSFKQVNSICVDPVRADSNVVLAAVFNGIFRSNDGGATWRAVLGLDTTISQTSEYTELRVTSTGVYYASIGVGSPSRGLWRSADGISWTNITPAGWSLNAERTLPAIDPGDEHVVYWFARTPGVGTQGHSFWKYTYLSGTGAGADGAWENRSANLPNGSCTGYFNFDFGYINTQSNYDMCLAVHPTLPNVVYLGGTSLYRSSDAFTSNASTKWIGGYKCTPSDPKDYVYDNHHPDQHWVAFDPADPTRLYSTNDGGVQVSTDPLADSVLWTDLNTGYITTQFYTIHLEEGEATNDLLLGGTQDNGAWLATSEDIADDWHYVHIDDGAYGALPQGLPFILTSSQAGRLYKKTLDASYQITGFERIDPIGGTNTYNFINPFVLDPVNNNVLYWVSAARIWRNNDLAGIPVTNNWYDRISTNWENLNATALPASQRITALVISRARHTTLFYGTVNSKLYRCDSLHSASPVRTEITSPLWPANSYVSCIAPNDLNPEEWLLTFSNYGIPSIWHTTDGGTTWTDVSGNLEENPDGTGSGPAVFWAATYATWEGLDDRYFVGTSAGLYSTALLDGANTIWEQEDPNGIGNVPVNMIAVRNSDGRVAVATHGNGVYSAQLPAAPFSVPSIASTGLLPAWPNPARQEVRIALQELNGPLDVVVTDARGRLLLQRRLGIVTGSWTWDLRTASGARVPAGICFIRLTDATGHDRTARVVVE
ncbi:MAG: hypothetical protein JNM31_15345 [Flavobacteriales bacterium]|nr:hypothetical protein [Flavobacteriales bacterium]